MKKEDIIIVVLLVMLLMAWTYKKNVDTSLLPKPKNQVVENMATNAVVPKVDQPVPANAVVEQAKMQEAKPEIKKEERRHLAPEENIELKNDDLVLTVSTWGGGIMKSELRQYRSTIDKASPPVVFDFTNFPALGISGINGFESSDDYKVVTKTSNSVTLSAVSSAGIELKRTLTLESNYNISVSDTFSVSSSTSSVIPEYEIHTGLIPEIKSASAASINFTSIDIKPLDGDLIYFSDGKNAPEKLTITDMFQEPGRRGGCGGCSLSKGKMAKMLDEKVASRYEMKVEWVASKNKYFTQVLAAPKGEPGKLATVYATREKNEKEVANDSATWVPTAIIKDVAAGFIVPAARIETGKPVERKYIYYVGPKKYSNLAQMGKSYGKIMEFGFWSLLCIAILYVFNFTYMLVPWLGYGFAIIVLAVLVRVIFWPLNKKSTESMKKMQEIQPLLTKLREKYKDNPQKMNQEMMELYKIHHVNPFAGCLPILVQIPVFFALFNVLRSAVELRYAGFLWIRDLSEQEALFSSYISFPINILPVVMTGLTIWQQKITPQMGDPQQQKMMMWMPVLFLALFYTMPSALVLYWTLSQVLALYQMVKQQKKGATGPTVIIRNG